MHHLWAVQLPEFADHGFVSPTLRLGKNKKNLQCSVEEGVGAPNVAWREASKVWLRECVPWQIIMFSAQGIYVDGFEAAGGIICVS